MEYLRILHTQKKFQSIKLVESLKSLENEIIKDANLREFNTETQIIKELFSIAGREDYKMSKDSWYIVKFNIYLFIAAHTPNNHIIPDFSKDVHTTYGPLFFAITILSTMGKDNQQPDFVMECLMEVKDKILVQEETSPYKFYALSTATYTHLLPTLASEIFGDKVMNIFLDFFQNLKLKNDECEKKLTKPLNVPDPKDFTSHSVQISYQTHQFLLEILRNVMKFSQSDFTDSLIIIVHTLWFNIKSSSTLLPLYFNFINHILLMEKPYKGTLPYDKERVTKMLFENARFRHNDIFKTLSPNLIFDFFNRATSNDLIKSRHTLRFICQFLFAEKQQDLLRKLKKDGDDNPNNPHREDNKFINNQIQQYNKGHARFPLLFLLEQLSTAFGYLTGILRQIKAIKIGPSDKNYKYFSEQVIDKSDLTEIDDLLYSKYEYVSYENKEEALKAYEKCFKYIDIFQERYALANSFFQKLMDLNESYQIHGHDAKNLNGMKVDGSNSSLFYNVKQLFTSFFKLIIEAGYRYMLLSQFLFSDACLTPQFSRYYSKCNYFDFNTIRTNLIKKIAEIFNKAELTDQLLQPYAKIIADLLFEAVKERHITNHVVIYLHLFNIPNPRDQHDSRLYQMVISHMLNFIYSNTYYIDDLDVEESNNFHQYLLLILQLGRKLRTGMSTFLLSLRQKQKAFMTILLNRFRCTNQREFLNTLIQYFRVLNENESESARNAIFEQTIEEIAKKKPLLQAPLLRYAMTDCRKELKMLASYLMLDKYVVDNAKPNIKQLIYIYLATAFQSNDSDLIDKAVNLCMPNLIGQLRPDSIKDNYQLLLDNDIDNCRPFYTSLFKSLLKATPEDSQKIIESIPKLLLLFNSWKTNVTTRQIGFIIPRYQVDLYNILTNLSIHFTGKESDAIHVFMFLNTLINEESFSENLDKIPIQVIDQIITNLTSLYVYKSLLQKVINLFKKLHRKFLPIVAVGNFNYIMSLFFNVQCSFSEGNSLYVKIIDMFFEMTTEIPESPSFNGTKVINSYFVQNRTLFNYNEMLVVLTMIQKRWPGCIRDEHYHLYLLSLTISNPVMIQHTKPELYSKPFNEFIKDYIANLTPDQVRPFLSTTIHFIETNKLLFIFKRVLFKRLSKARFQTPFKNFNHIPAQQQDKDVFYLMLYLTLLFGVQSNEQIPDSIFNRSIEEMRKIIKRESTILSSSSLYIIVYFIKIILLTQPDNSRYFNEEILKIIMFILNTVSFRLSPVDSFRKEIRKCIRLIREKSPFSYERFSKDLIDATSQMNTNNSAPANNITLLKNLVRQSYLFPECIQKDHIVIIYKQLNDFLNYPYQQKIKSLNQIIKFIAILSYPDYKSPHGMMIRQLLMSENKEANDHLSYFVHFIHVFVLMINDYSFPSYYSFIDSIILFTNNFKKETLEVIISHPFINEIEMSYDLLYNLVIEDKTDEFFTLIIDKFSELCHDDIASQHPAFFNVLNRLVKTKRFDNYPNLGEKVLQFFNAVMINIKTPADNKTTAMNILIDTAIDVIKNKEKFDQIIFITNYIATSSVNTPLYRKLKEAIFKNRERKFYVHYFIHLMANYNKLRPFEMIEIILVQLLKGLKSLKKDDFDNDEESKEAKIDLDELFLTEMRKMISNPEHLCCALGCFVVYFKYNKADSHNLPLVLSAFGPALMQPYSYLIIHVFKITNIIMGETYYSGFSNNSNNDNNNDNMNDNKDDEDDNNSNERTNTIDEKNIEILLPILSKLIQHILYFQKFLDQPYMQYVSVLLRKANQLFNKNNIPDSLADCFKQFIINKLIKCKEFDKIITVIQLIPVLIEVVPFSLVYSTFHNLDLCSQHMRNNTFKPDDHFTVIFFALKYTQKLKLTEDEESYIFKLSFNFLREVFKGEVRLKTPISDNFLKPLMSKAKYMPLDIFDIARNKFMVEIPQELMKNKNQETKYFQSMNQVFASFAVFATEAVDEQILLRNIDYIQRAFDEYIKKLTQFFRVYVQSIFNRPELVKTSLVDRFFEIVQNHPSIEARFLLLGSYITLTNHPDKFKYLSILWDKELPLINYQRLSSYIEFIPIEQQSDYLEIILEKTKEIRTVLYPVFITNFINSKKVSNSVKIDFLERLPFIINDFDALFTYKCYEAIQNLEFDTFGYELLLLFYTMVKTNDSSRLLYFEKLKKLTGDTEEQRFITLIEVIPSFLWTNTNLTFISLIIIDTENINNEDDESDGTCKLDIPLVMIADNFDSFSAEFMIGIFTRIINERTLSIIHRLLTECLSQHLNNQEQLQDFEQKLKQQQQQQKQRQNIRRNNSKKTNKFEFNNYTQIITVIVKSLHEMEIPIQPNLLYKTLKITNDFSMFSCLDNNFYSFDTNDDVAAGDDDDQSCMIPDKLLLPHKLNDTIFGSVFGDVSNETLAASAQFFLGNYEEAEMIYSRCSYPENKVVDRMQQIASDFVMKMNNSSKFSIFERLDHPDYLLVPALEQGYFPDKENLKGANEDLYRIDQLSRAERCNIIYFKHHPHLSIYERSRLSAIEMIIQMMQIDLKNKRRAASTTTNSTIINPNIPQQQAQPAPSVTPPNIPTPNPLPNPGIQVQMNVSTPLTPPMISPISPISSQTATPTPMISQVPMPQNQPMQFMNNPLGRPMPVPIQPQPQQSQGPPQPQIQTPQNQQQQQLLRAQPSQQFMQQQQQQQQQQQRPLQHQARAVIPDFKLLPYMNYMVESCMPPKISQFVIDFSREISNDTKFGIRFNSTNTKQSPFFVFSSEFHPFFSDLDWQSSTTIKSVDFHGFFAVNSKSVFDKFKQYQLIVPPQQNLLDIQQQEQQRQNSFDPFLWPSFCFNVFASSDKTSEKLFKICLESYLHLLTEDKPTPPQQPHQQQQQQQNRPGIAQMIPNQAQKSTVASPVITMPPFMVFAAAARVVDLFGYSISNQLENNQIFEASVDCINFIEGDKTTSYLKMWMPQMVSLRSDYPPKFREQTESISNSFGYIGTLMAHNMNIKQEHKKQANLYDMLARLCDLVLNISEDSFESARLRKNESKSSKFTKSTKSSNYSSSFCEDFVTMEDLVDEELNEEEKKIKKCFFDWLIKLNQHVPFEYDRRSPFNQKGPIRIIHFDPSFTRLSSNVVTFTCSTPNPPHQRFVVERVENTDDAVSFSNILEATKNIFKYSYGSRSRRIRLCTHPALELNQHFVMRLFPYDILKLREMKANYNNDNDDDDDDGNAAGVGGDDVDRLKQKLLNVYSKKDFFKLRRALVSSFAAFSVVRNMFSLRQPDANSFFVSLNSAEFPFLINEFEIPSQFGQTASFVNEEMQSLFGQSGQGELALSICAASDALARRIDSVRSLVEVPLFGCFENREKNIETVLTTRDWIDHSILSLAPPLKSTTKIETDTEIGAEVDEIDGFVESSVSWIENVQSFVNNSMEKFERVLYNDDFIQSSELNIHISNEPSFNLEQSSNSSSIINSHDAITGFSGPISRTSSTSGVGGSGVDNSNTSFQFLFQPHEDDDQGFGHFDDDSRDNQFDDFDGLF